MKNSFPEKAAVLKIKSNLMQTLQEHIKQQEYSQVHVAKLCKTTQPRISNLMKGKISDFSIDILIEMLYCLDLRVDVEIKRWDMKDVHSMNGIGYAIGGGSSDIDLNPVSI